MPLNRTLGELRGELTARLGFGSAGVNNGQLIPIVNNFLFSSQTQMYWGFDWRALRAWVIKTVGANQVNVDFPVEINADRVDWISMKYSNAWLPPMERGISAEMYTSQDRTSVPTHWDMNSASGSQQIEFWPMTDTTYQYRVFGMAPLTRFTQDGDRSTIDGDLVVLHALGAAKLHYKHPDAEYYIRQLMDLMDAQKSNNWAKRVFRKGDDAGSWLPKPLLVGRDI